MIRRFRLRELALSGLTLIERTPIEDSRGFLERLYGSEELGEVLGGSAIAQINRTLTYRRGTVRGMHYQEPPHAEVKFVTCLRGQIFDVAVDLRNGSPTLLKWHGEVLSQDEHTTLLIPKGFAHGFQTLTDDCELLYVHSAPYEPASEGGVNARDPIVGIRWPDEIGEMSARDAAFAMLTYEYVGITL